MKLDVYDHFCNLNSLYRIADIDHNGSQVYIISFDLFILLAIYLCDYFNFFFQRAVLNYVPETIGWGTIAAIMSVAAVSVVTAFFLARKQ